jgi:hypothetical protein
MPAAEQLAPAARSDTGADLNKLARIARRADVQAAALAALVGLVWLLFAPRTPDLAAQSYRVDLFQRDGFAIWDNGWYGGHHLPAYSLLFPPLGALIGLRVAGALAEVLAAFCFARLAERHFGHRARPGILWFALATGSDLAIGRLTYGLGAALGLAALLAAQRKRPALAVVLAALCGAATPLAGLFVGLVAATLLLTRHRRGALLLGIPALSVSFGLAIAFPEGGREPFGTKPFIYALVMTLAFLVLLGREQRVLRVGAALLFAATVASFVIDTPMGGNISRLGAVFMGPLLLCALAAAPRPLARRTLVGGVVALGALLAWQWTAPVREVPKGVGDPLTEASTYRGLFAFLGSHAQPPARVEVPFTRSHWETAFVGAHFPLARGWEKQLDTKFNPLFFHRPLPAATYHVWLRDLGVRYIALPDVPPDPSSRDEYKLLRRGTPFLRAVYRDRHWRVFQLLDPAPLIAPPASLVALGRQSFSLRFAAAGRATAHVRFSPYWQADRGCVSRAPGGWTSVSARRAGLVRVRIRFSPARIAARRSRCA